VQQILIVPSLPFWDCATFLSSILFVYTSMYIESARKKIIYIASKQNDYEYTEQRTNWDEEKERKSVDLVNQQYNMSTRHVIHFMSKKRRQLIIMYPISKLCNFRKQKKISVGSFRNECVRTCQTEREMSHLAILVFLRI
jgi:hypothetical protein